MVVADDGLNIPNSQMDGAPVSRVQGWSPRLVSELVVV